VELDEEVSNNSFDVDDIGIRTRPLQQVKENHNIEDGKLLINKQAYGNYSDYTTSITI